jgi:hypothetical protein
MRTKPSAETSSAVTWSVVVGCRVRAGSSEVEAGVQWPAAARDEGLQRHHVLVFASRMTFQVIPAGVGILRRGYTAGHTKPLES